MDHHSIEPGNDSRLIDEVMDGIEPGQSDDNEIDRNDDVEKPRHHQDQNSGDERDKRGDMGGGDDHWVSFGLGCNRGGAGNSTEVKRTKRRSVLAYMQRLRESPLPLRERAAQAVGEFWLGEGARPDPSPILS